MSDRPLLSIVVLSWNQLDLTRACVKSLRAGTLVDHELIIVDNGSTPDVAAWVQDAADLPVLLPENLGFARGMNAGLAVATGTYVAFVNNDTSFPMGWAEPLLESAQRHPGIITPAVTAAGGPYGVRSEPGTEVIVIPPYRHLPSGVVYLTDRHTINALGGWDERYRTASREDLDLLFGYWTNGLSVTLDTRVLVDHVSSATVRGLSDREAIWDRNWRVFIDKWTDPAAEIPRLETVATGVFEARRREAATAATWMDRWYKAEEGRKEALLATRHLETRRAESERLASRMELPGIARLWSRVRKRVPEPVRRGLFPYVRSLYYRAFPAGRADD